MSNEQFLVVDLGGSIIVPGVSERDGINVGFLKEFRSLVQEQIQKGRRCVIVAGGGKTCRWYQNAAHELDGVTNEDLDWIGIHATRLNAHLLRTMFAKEAHPRIIDYDLPVSEADKLKETGARLFIASGWRPGWSTDYVSVRLAEKFGAENVLIMSNIAFVYDKDPKKYADARPLEKISWKEYQELIPKSWTPGMTVPVDPVATALATRIKLTVKLVEGTDLANSRRAMEGDAFQGTIIS